MIKSGIYKIQSKTEEQKFYIGSSVNLSKRKAGHFYLLKRNKSHAKYLQNYYNKYGEDSLTFVILEECPIDQLLKKEQEYLDKLLPRFNHRKIAESNYGIRVNRVPGLTEEKVKEIKKLLYLMYTPVTIAKKYLIGKDVVRNIKEEKTWTHIKLDLNIDVDITDLKKKNVYSKEDIEMALQALKTNSGMISKLSKTLGISAKKLYSLTRRRNLL